VEIYSVTTAVIHQWIGLPEETIYLQRYNFLDTFLSMPHSLIAILYLDAVWDIYKNPINTFASRNQENWKQKPSTTI
jgi:hypothetical protein